MQIQKETNKSQHIASTRSRLRPEHSLVERDVSLLDHSTPFFRFGLEQHCKFFRRRADSHHADVLEFCVDGRIAQCGDGTVPTPGDANVTLPFFSRANAMKSETDFAGDAFGTTIKRGNMHTNVTGARSLMA